MTAADGGGRYCSYCPAAAAAAVISHRAAVTACTACTAYAVAMAYPYAVVVVDLIR